MKIASSQLVCRHATDTENGCVADYELAGGSSYRGFESPGVDCSS